MQLRLVICETSHSLIGPYLAAAAYLSTHHSVRAISRAARLAKTCPEGAGSGRLGQMEVLWVHAFVLA